MSCLGVALSKNFQLVVVELDVGAAVEAEAAAGADDAAGAVEAAGADDAVEAAVGAGTEGAAAVDGHSGGRCGGPDPRVPFRRGWSCCNHSRTAY